MSKIYVAERDTGDFIKEVNSIEEAREAISHYEDWDKANDCYDEDWYDIVDENHMTIAE